MELGLALGQNGQGVSSMGPAVAELDGPGNLDILVPDMDYGSLHSKQGEFWTDMQDRSGLALICGQYTGWGAVVQDFDNDGYADVFIANGDSHHEYPEEAVLARNDGKGRLRRRGRRLGRVLPDEVVEPRRDLGRLRRRRQRRRRRRRHLRPAAPAAQHGRHRQPLAEGRRAGEGRRSAPPSARA